MSDERDQQWDHKALLWELAWIWFSSFTALLGTASHVSLDDFIKAALVSFSVCAGRMTAVKVKRSRYKTPDDSDKQ